MSITIEQAKLCYGLGIKQRKDGKWGFKLRCANRTCENRTDTCYCEDTVEEAIETVQKSRSAYHCSTECWYSDTRYWDRDVEWQEILDGNDLEDEVKHFYGIPKSPYSGGILLSEATLEEEAAYETATDAMWRDFPKRVRNENPELYKRLQEWVRGYYSDNYDYEPDDGECECEI